MHTWVCGILGVNFEEKNAPRSSCLVFGVRSHGPTGLKIGALWIHFPVWRELKRIIRACRPLWIQCFGYTFPFEGNWNINPTENRGTCHALDTLSRLKGIETPTEQQFKDFQRHSLDTLSRLKGIETRVVISFCLLRVALWIHFPVWRELKRKCSKTGNAMAAKMPLDTLSRLKGIETSLMNLRRTPFLPLDTLSRLKGIETWRLAPDGSLTSWILLWIHFPVWRELKHFGIWWGFCLRFIFGYTFPFEGNWNASRGLSHQPKHCFGYTFPFEGNWNFTPYKYLFIDHYSLDTLSRLKGIETGFRPQLICRILLVFGYTFRLKGIETILREIRARPTTS